MLTVVGFWAIFKFNSYTFPVETHTVVGAITLVGITILFVTGSLAIISRKQAPEVWGTGKLLRKGRIHRLIAYTVLVLSNITILLGAVLKFSTPEYRVPFFINAILVLSILLAGEVNYRKTMAREDPFRETEIVITLDEFKQRI